LRGVFHTPYSLLPTPCAVVRLAVVDVDGCLTPGEARGWNWEALRAVGELNRCARRGEDVPAVTLCTGRQEPYVEVLMQAIGAYLPGIYENGCGLFFPDGYRFAEHPSITAATREALAAARATLQRQVVAPGVGYFQPGKEVSLTLYPLPGVSVGRLYEAVVEALCAGGRDAADRVTVQASVSCVDVTPTGIDKGAGVRWLSEEVGCPLADMGGIGDSISDLMFLRLVGWSAAPANAATEVRASVAYVSPYGDGDGVVDILHRWCKDRRKVETPCPTSTS
jgi:hydroxymethylpyrimidine pyrophosphatase-like HAD family hydrolase